MLVVHVCLIVLVTIYALEYRVIRRVDMAIGAGVPLFPVLARVNREILRIVIPICRRPGAGRVTTLTLSREIGCLVVWICSAVVCSLMT